MGLPFFPVVTWIAMLLVSISSITMTVNSQVEGCSLTGIDLEQCLTPSDSLQFSLHSCCNSLDIAVKAGYYCLCSLFGPSESPIIYNTQLAISFSNCNISVPSLTHCQVMEPLPFNLPPPIAIWPPPIQPQMSPPIELPRDADEFVHLPPKVKESPTNTKAIDNSSTADGNQSAAHHKLRIPERWGLAQSDGAENVHVLLLSRNLLPVAVFAFT